MMAVVPPVQTPAPTLRIHHIPIFVSDQDRSVAFYRDRLGFSVLTDYRFENGDRFILVKPPDGDTALALLTPRPGSSTRPLIGTSRGTVLVTNDIGATFSAWRDRGVAFLNPEPSSEVWGGVTAPFEDVDGNQFVLAAWDAVTREVEARLAAVAAARQVEQRAAMELALARDVQARLFPRGVPVSESFDGAGRCLQTRDVGGDYYDFLDLGDGRVGVVVGDVSGKGIAAALMMANLQANVRSQAATAGDDLDRAVRTINTLFFDNSPEASFATLFFAVFHSRTGRLTYVNCGHEAALVLRHDGATVERLASSSRVIGLFRDAVCSVEESHLDPGDILAIATDGIVEAANAAGEEFGVQRFCEVVARNAGIGPGAMIDAVLEEIRGFSGGEQRDDITMVVASRRRECPNFA